MKYTLHLEAETLDGLLKELEIVSQKMGLKAAIEKSEAKEEAPEEPKKKERKAKAKVEEEETFDLGSDEETEDDADDEADAEDDNWDVEKDIIPAFKAYAKEHSREKALKVLKKYGAKSVHDLATKDYQKVMHDIT